MANQNAVETGRIVAINDQTIGMQAVHFFGKQVGTILTLPKPNETAGWKLEWTVQFFFVDDDGDEEVRTININYLNIVQQGE